MVKNKNLRLKRIANFFFFFICNNYLYFRRYMRVFNDKVNRYE